MTHHTVDLAAALLVGLSGSAHCAGMCGGLALAGGWGSADGVARRGLGRLAAQQAVYHLGKTTSYLFLGALAGWGGMRIAQSPWRAALAVVAAIALFAVGWTQLGGFARLRFPPGFVRRFAPAWSALVRVARDAPPALRPFLLGGASGLLPCPLVYAFLVAGAATGAVGHSLLLLATLGLATVPALFLTVLAGRALAPRRRLALTRISGVLLCAAAVYTALRGFERTPCCGGDAALHTPTVGAAGEMHE